MADIQGHYQNFLAPYYEWIFGGLSKNLIHYRAFFKKHKVSPLHSGVAVDLGSGCGFQSIPLAETGFNVIAIDQSQALLKQLGRYTAGLPIVVIQDNLLNFTAHCPAKVELIICMGDTLSHLNSQTEVRQLVKKAYRSLEENGILILGFRDLSDEVMELDRFIPVRNDSKRIFTCFLEFEQKHVKVHDIIYEKAKDHWDLKKSYFRKLRISQSWANDCLQKAGFIVELCSRRKGLVTILARKH